jgi:hypothetical protein
VINSLDGQFIFRVVNEARGSSINGKHNMGCTHRLAERLFTLEGPRARCPSGGRHSAQVVQQSGLCLALDHQAAKVVSRNLQQIKNQN